MFKSRSTPFKSTRQSKNPRLIKRPSSVTMPTGGPALNEYMKNITKQVQLIILALETDPFDPSLDDKYSTEVQIAAFKKIGADFMTEEMAGGGIFDTLKKGGEIGKNLFLGVYVTYLKRPVDVTEEVARSLYPKIKAYVEEEVEKFKNLATDSQVLRAIKIMASLSALYSIAPAAGITLATVLSFTTRVVSATSSIVVPLLPSIAYYLTSLGFLARYGKGYYSMMAILNYYLFPTDYVTPVAVVLGYMFQKRFDTLFPGAIEGAEALFEEQKQVINEIIAAMNAGAAEGAEELRARVDMVSRPLFTAFEESKELLDQLARSMIDTTKLGISDLTYTQEYLKFLINAGKTFSQKARENAAVAGLIDLNPETARTTGENLAATAGVDLSDADIMDLGVGAHLLADALVQPGNENEGILDQQQVEAAAKTLLEMREDALNRGNGNNAAPAVGGKRRSKRKANKGKRKMKTHKVKGNKGKRKMKTHKKAKTHKKKAHKKKTKKRN